MRALIRRDQPGPYQLQAAINAVHSDPPPTDWRQIVALYDQLLAFTPTPVVALNRAIAIAETDGPAGGARRARRRSSSTGYHLFHAIRADLLRRLRRDAEARAAYDAAIACTDNAAERDFLGARLRSLIFTARSPAGHAVTPDIKAPGMENPEGVDREHSCRGGSS